MNADQAKCATLVVLKTPFKPQSPSKRLRKSVGNSYQDWTGFRYGMICHVEDQGRVLFLFLYDTKHGILWIDNGIPVRTQFSLDEVDFLKDPGEFPVFVQV